MGFVMQDTDGVLGPRPPQPGWLVRRAVTAQQLPQPGRWCLRAGGDQRRQCRQDCGLHRAGVRR